MPQRNPCVSPSLTVALRAAIEGAVPAVREDMAWYDWDVLELDHVLRAASVAHVQATMDKGGRWTVTVQTASNIREVVVR